jgi:STE24 endopeptidase
MSDDARTYHRARLIFAAATVLAGAGVLALGVRATALLPPPAPRRWIDLAGIVAVELALLGAARELVTAPLTVAGGYWLPRRFGLLHQPWRRWLLDRAKATLIRAGLGLLAFEILYALLWVAPLWWLAAAVVFFAGDVLRVAVAPIWLMPLFHHLTPLQDRALAERLTALAERARVPVLGVWVGDQSRKSRTANGTVTGIGRTRRMVLWDTLLRFPPEEIEFVLAHELGHHAHDDVRRILLLRGALLLAKFWIADRLLALGVAWWDWRGIADPAGLPWLALMLLGLGLAAAPLVNAYSRRIERQADDFALATTGNVAAFVGAIERLAALNLAERRPSRLEEWLLYTHPSTERRLARHAPRSRGPAPAETAPSG